MSKLSKILITAAGILLSANALAVKPVNVKVPVDSRGMTIEQKNIADRVIRDNKPGSIKHLYVISAMTGDILIYSSVKGKVTSSGKRLQPNTITHSEWMGDNPHEFRGDDGKTHHTTEMMQDDGTYGSSVPYVFWFDQKGAYHQHYITGGQIFHVSDVPLAVGKAIINIE